MRPGAQREILRGNLALLDAWIAADPGSSYEKPRSGTTALVKYDVAIPSYELCVRLVNEVGVMEMEGHVRVEYAKARRNLEMGLPRVTAFLATLRASRGATYAGRDAPRCDRGITPARVAPPVTCRAAVAAMRAGRTTVRSTR